MGIRAYDQAGCRLHCRLHRAGRQADGHAGAIVSGGKGTAQDKKEALEAVGIRVGRTPGQTAEIMREVLASKSI
mgnify:CR=1 FL=1